MLKLRGLIILTLTSILSGCGSGSDSSATVTPPPPNQPPVADAGADQSVDEGATVELSGSGTDSDGNIISYNWLQEAGTVVTITNADQANASFVAPTVSASEVLLFRLTVTDDDVASGSDTVSVTINNVPVPPPPPPNQAPTANAGVDQTVHEDATVSLSGTGADTDGTIEVYSWQQISGSAVVITNADMANASFTAPMVEVAQELIFRLTVTDDDDATGSDTVTITVNNTVPSPPQVQLQQVFAGLTPALAAPVSLQQAPGDATRWFIVEQAGTIRAFANDDGATATLSFLDITGRVRFGGERGLLGMAFHPDFPNTPEVFVSYTRQPDGTSLVSRFTSTDGGQTLDPSSEQVILSMPQDFANHNGGNIVFGPDGHLYIGFGDGGDGGDPLERAQDNTNLLGTMVRIDIDGGSPYAIPAAEPANPFAVNQICPQGFSVGGEECPEIFAWGLRNPWRFSFDRQTGSLWAGDVGQNAWEEIDIVTTGGDYGWDDKEGSSCYEPASGCIDDSIDPVTEYGRDLGASVTGGYVYRGSGVPDLAGWYVFGDFVSGRLFAIPADSETGTLPEVLQETGLAIAAFGESVDGELFVVNYGGSVHQIISAP
jgi:glucose/arabinose dehydrogenase